MNDYETAVRINPRYPGSYNNIGVIYGGEGNYSEAIKYFKKALELDPIMADAYMNCGMAYLDG